MEHGYHRAPAHQGIVLQVLPRADVGRSLGHSAKQSDVLFNIWPVFVDYAYCPAAVGPRGYLRLAAIGLGQ